jgi:hypothetical protein
VSQFRKLGKKLSVLDIGPQQADNVHGWSRRKDGALLHETVSSDVVGWADIASVSAFLDNEQYGIHAIIDLEGHIAWSCGDLRAIFWHAASSGRRGNGYVNTRFIGIELVSNVMLRFRSRPARIKAWLGRDKQINACAKLLATLSRLEGFPLTPTDTSPGKRGVGTHWEATHRWGVYGGHTDCWPSTSPGGYFPRRLILKRAKMYRKLGY